MSDAESNKGKALSWPRRFGYSVGNMGVGLLPSVIGGWALYYLSPPVLSAAEIADGRIQLPTYIAASVVGLTLAIGRITEGLLNPFIGNWSDRTRTRWGRRIPYLLFGSPVMVMAFVLMWFPPVSGESMWNVVFIGAMAIIANSAFAVVVAPYLSLLPEITPYNNERVSLSALMAVFEVLGVLLAMGAAPVLIEAGKQGLFGHSYSEFNGFMLVGLIAGALTLLVFWISAFTTKEKYQAPIKEKQLPFFTGVRETFGNPGFPSYVTMLTMFRIGIDTIVVVIPYLVVTVLHQEESMAGLVQLTVLLGSVLLFPLVSWLADKWGKKKTYLICAAPMFVVMPLVITLGHWPFLEPLTQAFILFGLAALPVAALNVLPRPILADIIDEDERRTGLRREGLYNGMEGLFTRSASGVAWILSSLLFFLFGKSTDNPLGIMLCGPVGGLLVFIGWLVFFRYPSRR